MTGGIGINDSKVSGKLYFQRNIMKRIEELYNFFMMMFVSSLFRLNPVYGGALYISGLVWINYTYVFNPDFSKIKKARKPVALAAIVISLAASVYLSVVYPIRFYDPGVVFILVGAFTVLIRPGIDRMIKQNFNRLIAYIIITAAFSIALIVFAPSETHIPVTVAMLISCLVSYFRNKRYQGIAGIGTIDEITAARKARNIHSYRIYTNTVVLVTAAIHIMVMMYVGFMRYVTTTNLVGNILNTYVTSVLAVVVIFATVVFLQKKVKLEHYEKTLIFVIAAVSWIVAALNIYDSGIDLGNLTTYINIILFIMSMSFVILVLAAMQDDFKGVLSLGGSKADDRHVSIQIEVLHRQSMFVAYFTVLIMLITLCIDPVHQQGEISDPGRYTQLVSFYMLVVPVLFILIGILFSIRQPLTRKYIEKLKLFREHLKRNQKSPDLEKQLITVLVKKYKARFGIKVIAFILYPIMKHTVEGKQNVRDINPAVFVCNHKKIYGPVVANLYIPYVCRPWIISGMVHKEEIYDHLINGYNMKKSKLPRFIKKAYCRMVSPLFLWAMNSVEPIPVYRNKGRDILKTIEMTVDAMKQEDNILLFPEDQTKTEGFEDKPGDFFMGFAHIGKAYFRETGKKITFYPVYADSEKRVIYIGKGITYDNTASQRVERDRIVEYLKHKMDDMAAGNT